MSSTLPNRIPFTRNAFGPRLRRVVFVAALSFAVACGGRTPRHDGDAGPNESDAALGDDSGEGGIADAAPGSAAGTVDWDASNVPDGASACFVRGNATVPPFEIPNEGVGYERVTVWARDFGELEAACTDDVFAELMRRYCKSNTDYTQYEIELFTRQRRCGASGCDFHGCPK